MMSTLQITQREAKEDYKHKGCVRQGRQGSQYARVSKSQYNPTKLNNRAVKSQVAQDRRFGWT